MPLSDQQIRELYAELESARRELFWLRIVAWASISAIVSTITNMVVVWLGR